MYHAHRNDSFAGISVIVLTWNGIELIKECFAHVVHTVEQWDLKHEIILVDNGSCDNTITFVKEQWPHIKIIALEKNKGFSYANNRAAQEAQYDTLLFLNNDIILADDFITPLLQRLQTEEIFAVAPKMLRWDRKTVDDGLRYGKYYSGLFSVCLDSEAERIDKPHWVTFFCGACFLCKRHLFFALGGFDEIYTPYAWEDLDLAYRAWKQGYKVIYEPKALCYHKREATTRKLFSHFSFMTLMWRNKFIFIWKNITYPPYFINHCVLLPWKLLKFLFNGRWRHVIGFLRAIRYIPRIYFKRRRETKKQQFNDKEVLMRSYQVIHG